MGARPDACTRCLHFTTADAAGPSPSVPWSAYNNYIGNGMVYVHGTYIYKKI